MGGSESHQAPVKVIQDAEKLERLTNILSLKSEHQEQIAIRGWDSHENDIHNNNMLKGVFKKLDPTVMKPIGAVMGEIQLSFKYDIHSEILMVKVIKCRELLKTDVRAKLVDTFVRMVMEPDSFRHGVKATQIVRQTTSPRFDEIFSYRLPEFELGNGKLIFQVVEHTLGGQDDIMGEVIVNLNSFSFRSDPVHTAWYMLNTETDLTISGDLDVSIAFQVPQTLLVTVHGANNLAPRDDGRSADPFVKLTVPGSNKMYQTQVQKNTLDPVWAETFEFPVHEEEFEEKFIIFHVIDKDGSSSNDSLGQCIVDLKEVSGEVRGQRGLHGNYPLSDLRNSERMRSLVYQKKTAQQFREALVAHSVAKAPGCLFKNHEGKKVVTVRCRKAGAQGRIRIVDGIPVY